jgi:hypothetical protein
VNFLDFEAALRKLSPSELESYRKTYALKTSILGKVTAERLQEREETVKKCLVNRKS